MTIMIGRGADHNYKPQLMKVVEEDPDDPFHDQNMALAKRMWSVLQFHYPGHWWLTGANHRQGIATVKFPMFTSYSMMIKLSTLKTDPGMKSVIRAGGEFLERYRLPRSGIDFTHMVHALNYHIPELSYEWRPPE